MKFGLVLGNRQDARSVLRFASVSPLLCRNNGLDSRFISRPWFIPHMSLRSSAIWCFVRTTTQDATHRSGHPASLAMLLRNRLHPQLFADLSRRLLVKPITDDLQVSGSRFSV